MILTARVIRLALNVYVGLILGICFTPPLVHVIVQILALEAAATPVYLVLGVFR